MRFRTGIGIQIFGGFVLLVLVALSVGGVGYWALIELQEAGNIRGIAGDLSTLVLEARRQEKNYILRKDVQSHEKLMTTLEEWDAAKERLASVLDEKGKTSQLGETGELYKKAALELKQLEEDDADAVRVIQDSGAKIVAGAEEKSRNAASGVKESIIKTTSTHLKQSALRRIKELVAVGYDVIRNQHDSGMSQEDALEMIRNMHFDGENYYYVLREDLTLAAHGADRSLEGKSFEKLGDKKTGKLFIKELVEYAILDGEAYTEYSWTKPGSGDAIFPKLTYAKHYRPWGLIVCAGAYIEDIAQEVSKTESAIQEGLDRLQQANEITQFTLEGRLNAAYYFAFKKDAEKVVESFNRVKQLHLADDGLKKDVDSYLAGFARYVNNSQTRESKIEGIGGTARKAMEISGAIEEEAGASFDRSASRGKTTMVGLVIGGALAGLLMGALLVAAITRPLKRVIEGLTESSEQVVAASTQVASASHGLAEDASAQAASLEETSSALEELSSMVKQNAGNSSEANQLMKEAACVVERAGDSMARMTSCMHEISTASEETQKIIKTIDEIAFQTNLLALNAAVEAARAGEVGAGFAVVADEVRGLAMRAADAARSTAGLIEGTVKKVKEGAELVQRTNTDFTEVARSVKKSEALVSEITAASQEQAQGIEEVTKAVGEMDETVQHNAANAEESASASEEMNAQAQQMKTFVVDLAGLIGGEGGNGANRPAAFSQEAVEDLNPPRNLPEKGQAPKAFRALPAESSGNGKGNGKDKAGEKGISPERVIPFDNEEFSDF